MQPAQSSKITFIDNVRVLLTVLVIMHHTAITYGAPGSWYFADATTNKPALILFTLFVAINQSYFMGLFFFISAFFIEASYNKKGAAKFIADRLKRLGIPLLFYSFILGPVMNYIVYRYGFQKQATFTQYLQGYDDWIDPGVMWFVAALLLFTLVYVLARVIVKHTQHKTHRFPSNNTIMVFALLLGVVSYVVRIFYPVGWTLKPLGFQLGHFPQYISMFCFGIVAYRSNWINNIELQSSKRFLAVALILVFIIFPSIFVAVNGPLEAFQGKGTLQSLLASVWEQVTGISTMVAVTGIAKYKWNTTSQLSQHMSRAAYATYIIHPLFIICVTVFLKSWAIEPAIKFFIAAPCAVILSFFFAWLVTKLPVANNVV